MNAAKPHILFVCGRNQWRSPAAERLYANDQRIEVRSAGVSPMSARRISRQDLEWADLVLVMEPRHAAKIVQLFRDMRLPRCECLDIPDECCTMDDGTLEALIREGTEGFLAANFGETVAKQ